MVFYVDANARPGIDSEMMPITLGKGKRHFAGVLVSKKGSVVQAIDVPPHQVRGHTTGMDTGVL